MLKPVKEEVHTVRNIPLREDNEARGAMRRLYAHLQKRDTLIIYTKKWQKELEHLVKAFTSQLAVDPAQGTIADDTSGHPQRSMNLP